MLTDTRRFFLTTEDSRSHHLSLGGCILPELLPQGKYSIQMAPENGDTAPSEVVITIPDDHSIVSGEHGHCWIVFVRGEDNFTRATRWILVGVGTLYVTRLGTSKHLSKEETGVMHLTCLWLDEGLRIELKECCDGSGEEG